MTSFKIIPDISTQYRYSYKNKYSEASAMHFLFSLLRIKGLYMFRVLLAHFQEALHERHLTFCVGVISVVCTRTGAANRYSTHAI
jgi:hypothetical protein